MIDSSQNSGVPSYTPPQNRGGDWEKIVAFGCIKSINKNEKKHTDLFSHLAQINENEKEKANANIQQLLSLFLASDNL